MEKEITDGMKKDLEKVICDNYSCLARGDIARCYEDIYKFCQRYQNERFKDGGK